jgi:hypothetical protein
MLGSYAEYIAVPEKTPSLFMYRRKKKKKKKKTVPFQAITDETTIKGQFERLESTFGNFDDSA